MTTTAFELASSAERKGTKPGCGRARRSPAGVKLPEVPSAAQVLGAASGAGHTALILHAVAKDGEMRSQTKSRRGRAEAAIYLQIRLDWTTPSWDEVNLDPLTMEVH